MSSSNKVKSNFALQATILAAASIVSKLIGMVYNIPLVNILNNNGNGNGISNGYYGAAQTVYFWILVISTFSIPSAISKIMAERIEKGEYRNVRRIFNGAMLYVAIAGFIGAFVAFFAAPVFMTAEQAVLSLRVLAPTIFLSGFVSVYRGYYQAYGNMVPTSLSQVIEQVFNATGSIAFTILFIKIALPSNDLDKIDQYGAAGGTVGTGVGLLAGFLYIFIKFQSERKELKVLIQQDKHEDDLSYGQVMKLLLGIASPIILCSAIYNSNGIIDMTIFQKITEYMGYGDEVVSGQYGMYSRVYLVLANIPIAMAAAVASTVIPTVSTAFSVGNIKECNRKLSQSMQLSMIMTIPCAMGFAVLGKPIVRLLFFSYQEQEIQIIGKLLLLGGISIVIYSVSNVLTGVLQGIGKVSIPAITAAIAMVSHIVLLVLLIAVTHLEIYSIIYATAFYAVIVVLLNMRYIKKELGYVMEWKEIFYTPLVSSIVMGIVAVISYKAIYLICEQIHVGDRICNAVAVLLAIFNAAMTYFVAMIRIGGYTKEKLETLPKGAMLARVASKLHLLKE